MASDFLSEEVVRKFEREITSLQKDLSHYEKMRSLVLSKVLNGDSHQVRHAGEVIDRRLKDKGLSEDAKQFVFKRLELMLDPTDAVAREKLFTLFNKYGLGYLANEYAVEAAPDIQSPRERVSETALEENITPRNKIESPRGSPRSGFLSRVSSKLVGLVSPRSRKSERPAISDEDSIENISTPRIGLRPD